MAREELTGAQRKERSDVVVGGVLMVALGIWLWAMGMGVLALIPWGLVVCALIPDEWYPKTRRAKAFEAEVHEKAADLLSDRIRADRREGRERDLRAWDEEFYGSRRPAVSHPIPKAADPQAAHGQGGAMTPEEYERNLKRVEERAKAARNVFPMRAIFWTFLALAIFLAPMWGH